MNEKREKYYKEALSWYSDIFNMPNSERVVLIIVTTFTVTAFLFMMYAAYSFLPLAPTTPYRITSQDALGEIPSIVRLTHGTEKNLAITRFILKEYTEARENYDVKKIERSYNLIKQFSSPETLEEYRNYMKISNPDSPLRKYERHTRRKIFIESSIVNKTENWLNNQAVINFQAIEMRGDNRKVEDMQAVITFNFDKIIVNQDTGEFERVVVDPDTGKSRTEQVGDLGLKLEVIDYSVRRR